MDLVIDVGGGFDEDETVLVAELAVHRAGRAAENAVNRHAHGGRLAVHRAAATDDEIGVPDEVEAIDDSWRNYEVRVSEPLWIAAAQFRLLARVAGQQHRFDSRAIQRPPHESCEQQLRFRIVIVGLGGRGARGHHDLGIAQAEMIEDRLIRLEIRHVNVLLDSVVGADAMGRGFPMAGGVDCHRRQVPAGFQERRFGGVLIVHDFHDGNAHQFGREVLAAGAEVEREVRALAAGKTHQLTAPHQQPPNFGNQAPAVVAADLLIVERVKARHLAGLVAVPGRQHHLVSLLPQLTDDGAEERNVRRVFQVDPNLDAGRTSYGRGRRFRSGFRQDRLVGEDKV